ncbi:MAG TPA: hypothetical protein VLG45_08160 [Thermodesulfobacteriota bacterium]|nr:hypothetical protein [Thermodesulfobacteriota bacterium]
MIIDSRAKPVPYSIREWRSYNVEIDYHLMSTHYVCVLQSFDRLRTNGMSCNGWRKQKSLA